MTSSPRIGRTLAESTPARGVPPPRPPSAPSMLLSLFDDVRFSWSRLDVGRDRGSPVSHDAAPFEFTDTPHQVMVSLDPPLPLDGQAGGAAEMARP